MTLRKTPSHWTILQPSGEVCTVLLSYQGGVKVGPEVLQQVSSSLPFLSGNSLLNSGFPETAYFAPRPTAHDENRAHIKYRGELDHMTILHISITSALYHWLLQNQNYKKINMHAHYFQTGSFEFVNFQAPAPVGGHKFAITSSILKWLDVLFTGNWLSWCLQYILVHGVGSFHVILIQSWQHRNDFLICNHRIRLKIWNNIYPTVGTILTLLYWAIR